MARSIKIDDGVYQKIKKIAKEDRRDLKTVLELLKISLFWAAAWEHL